jgi:hypothetical protein
MGKRGGGGDLHAGVLGKMQIQPRVVHERHSSRCLPSHSRIKTHLQYRSLQALLPVRIARRLHHQHRGNSAPVC